MKPRGSAKGNVIGRYRIEGNKVSDTWNELEDYVARSLEYIRSTFPYSEKELLNKHEIDFFRILKRANNVHQEKAQKAEERKRERESRKR